MLTTNFFFTTQCVQTILKIAKIISQLMYELKFFEEESYSKDKSK